MRKRCMIQMTMNSVSSGEETESCETAENIDKKPLYPAVTIAVTTVMVLLSLFTIKHNLPAEAVQNLLTLFSLTLPSSHCLPNTIHRFKNYFKSLRNPLRIHYGLLEHYANLLQNKYCYWF